MAGMVCIRSSIDALDSGYLGLLENFRPFARCVLGEHASEWFSNVRGDPIICTRKGKTTAAKVSKCTLVSV